MAGTTLQDVIVPELFNPYVINRTMELSALVQSGIIVNNTEFDALASRLLQWSICHSLKT